MVRRNVNFYFLSVIGPGVKGQSSRGTGAKANFLQWSTDGKRIKNKSLAIATLEIYEHKSAAVQAFTTRWSQTSN